MKSSLFVYHWPIRASAGHFAAGFNDFVFPFSRDYDTIKGKQGRMKAETCFEAV